MEESSSPRLIAILLLADGDRTRRVGDLRLLLSLEGDRGTSSMFVVVMIYLYRRVMGVDGV